MSTKTFLQASKLKVNRIFTVLTSSRRALKSSLFLSFTQFIKDSLLVNDERGSLANIFPFITHKGSASTVNSAIIDDLSKSSNSKLILSVGHNSPIDPGVTINRGGRIFTETEAIVHTFDRIILAMQHSVARLSVDVLPWNELKYTISLVNDIYKAKVANGKAIPLHIAIHTDFAVSNIDSRPITLGVYYGSNAGKEIALKITNSFGQKMKVLYPDLTSSTWIRPDSASPHGRLGIIRDTTPVSLIAEIDFINRDIELLAICQEVFADVLINDLKLADYGRPTN